MMRDHESQTKLSCHLVVVVGDDAPNTDTLKLVSSDLMNKNNSKLITDGITPYFDVLPSH